MFCDIAPCCIIIRKLMARPLKDNADYFSHDAGMRNDTKIKAVRRKFGNEGYAIWVMLLEHLTNCDFFTYEINDLNLELLAGDFDIETEMLKSILKYFKTLKLIDYENGIIKSNNLIKRFEGMLSKRKRTRKVVIGVHNTQSKVKERKEKKIKENNTIEDSIKISITPIEIIKSDLLFWEQFQMKNKKQIGSDWDRMIENFNNKVDIEELPYKLKILKARLKSYCSSWLSNNYNFKKEEEKEIKIGRQTLETIKKNAQGWD